MDSKRYFDPTLPSGEVRNSDLSRSQSVSSVSEIAEFGETNPQTRSSNLNDEDFEIIEPDEQLSRQQRFAKEIKSVLGSLEDFSIEMLFRDFQNSSRMIQDATNAYLDHPEIYQVAPKQGKGIFSRLFNKRPSNALQTTADVNAGTGAANSSVGKKKRKTGAILVPPTSLPDPPEWTRYIGNFEANCWCIKPTPTKSIFDRNNLSLSWPTDGSSILYVAHDGRKFGRINEDIAAILLPPMFRGAIELRAKMVPVESNRLSTGQTFYIRLDCYLTETIFKHKPENGDHDNDISDYLVKGSSDTKEPESVLKSAMLKLFDILQMYDIHAPLNEFNQVSGMDVKDLFKSSSSHFVESLPLSYPPNFNVQLRPYQSQALSWMLHKENQLHLVGLNNDNITPEEKSEINKQLDDLQSTINPLWKEYHWPKAPKRLAANNELGDIFYFNQYDGSCSLTKPTLNANCNGGILADEMGLGKTITTLSLVLSNPKDNNEASTEKPYANGTTLIIVPMALLMQWESEFKKCTSSRSHSCFVYYGHDSQVDLSYLLLSRNAPTVIVTTYGTVQSEFKANKNDMNKGLFSVHFHRIILDEAHTIRNRSSKTSKAVFALEATNKWALTGTPVVNKSDDLYSLVTFLGVKPWSNHLLWNQCISQPLEQGKDPKPALELMKSIIDPILLRRTKDQRDKNGELLLQLPAKEIIMEKLKFNEKEATVYKWLKDMAVSEFRKNLKNGNFKNYSTILTQLLRLRQVCCDLRLIKAPMDSNDIEPNDPFLKIDNNDSLLQVNNGILSTEQTNNDAIDPKVTQMISEAQSQETDHQYTEEELDYLTIEMNAIYPSLEDAECSICTEMINIKTCVITGCKHPYCRSCLADHFQYQKIHSKEPVSCPMCRSPIDTSKLLKPVPFGDSYKLKPFIPTSSTKIAALMDHLDKINQDKLQHETTHIIVFSQFTSFLDIINTHLAENTDYTILQFDGRLNMESRDQVLCEFNRPPEGDKLKILLLSLKAGGTGLNLTVASRAFLMDPHWNHAHESQAIDRLHRMGQQKEVKVIRFIMQDSIEERMLQIQDRKSKMGEVITMSDEMKRKARLEELETLFAS